MALVYHSETVCQSVSVRVAQQQINCRSLLYAAKQLKEAVIKPLKASVFKQSVTTSINIRGFNTVLKYGNTTFVVCEKTGNFYYYIFQKIIIISKIN